MVFYLYLSYPWNGMKFMLKYCLQCTNHLLGYCNQESSQLHHARKHHIFLYVSSLRKSLLTCSLRIIACFTRWTSDLVHDIASHDTGDSRFQGREHGLQFPLCLKPRKVVFCLSTSRQYTWNQKTLH